MESGSIFYITLGENIMKLNRVKEMIGEGTDWDLDYGKVLIIALSIYIAIQVS